MELRADNFFCHILFSTSVSLPLACLQIPVLKTETNQPTNRKPKAVHMSGDIKKVLFQMSSLQEFCVVLVPQTFKNIQGSPKRFTWCAQR